MSEFKRDRRGFGTRRVRLAAASNTLTPEAAIQDRPPRKPSGHLARAQQRRLGETGIAMVGPRRRESIGGEKSDTARLDALTRQAVVRCLRVPEAECAV